MRLDNNNGRTGREARAVALASRLMFALMGASPGGKLPIQ